MVKLSPKYSVSPGRRALRLYLIPLQHTISLWMFIEASLIFVINETDAAFMSGQPSDAYTQTCDDWNNVTDYFLDLGEENVVVTLEHKGAVFSSEKGKGFAVPAVEVLLDKYLIQLVQGMLPSMLSLFFPLSPFFVV